MSQHEVETSRARKPVFERDAYPKMIVVCMVISLVLLTVILGAIFLDLSTGVRDAPADLSPEERAFFEEHGVSTEPAPGNIFAPDK